MKEHNLINHKVLFGQSFPPEENKSIIKKVRVTPSQLKLWEESLNKLGVKDFSSFARGAIQGAIEMSFRTNDPKWKNFVQEIQPIALKILGYNIFDDGAKDVEGYGTERIGSNADEFIKSLETGIKPTSTSKVMKSIDNERPNGRFSRRTFGRRRVGHHPTTKAQARRHTAKA